LAGPLILASLIPFWFVEQFGFQIMGCNVSTPTPLRQKKKRKKKKEEKKENKRGKKKKKMPNGLIFESLVA
jgi:hypothetical protein